MRNYPLEPMKICGDFVAVISKGHHDIHDFMREVRKHWNCVLSVPEHFYMRTVPPREDDLACWYEVVPKGTRGAWPATYAHESPMEDSYEHRYPKGKPK